jgi:ubiquinone biosynthesis protein UbiJ
VVRLFDERDKIDIPIPGHNQNALARVAGLVRVLEDVQEATGFHSDHHTLEGDATLEEKLGVLLRAPSKRLH